MVVADDERPPYYRGVTTLRDDGLGRGFIGGPSPVKGLVISGRIGPSMFGGLVARGFLISIFRAFTSRRPARRSLERGFGHVPPAEEVALDGLAHQGLVGQRF